MGTQTAHTFTHADRGIGEMGEQFGASDSQCIELQEGILHILVH
jgi:hypothetical protein